LRSQTIGVGLILLLFGSVIFVLVVVDVPQTHAVQVTQTNYLAGGGLIPAEYSVPSGSYHSVYAQLEQGTTLSISLSTLFPLDFYIMDQGNFSAYSSNMPSTAVLIDNNIHLYETSWTVPYSDTWYFVFADQNPVPQSSLFSPIYVAVTISESYLTTQEVTVNAPLLSSDFVVPAVVFWLFGILILGVGVAQHPLEESKSKRY
jgi:hypothetical protein